MITVHQVPLNVVKECIVEVIRLTPRPLCMIGCAELVDEDIDKMISELRPDIYHTPWEAEMVTQPFQAAGELIGG